MSALTMPPATLFTSLTIYARSLAAHEVPALQAFFEANPEYFQSVNGRPPNPDEAQAEFDELPPARLAYSGRWVLGLFDRSDDQLVGIAGTLSDFVAAKVWHVSLFILASQWHGQGRAGDIYAEMEAWMRLGGAQWLRLGVVAGNAKAERFWAKLGYQEVRRREGIDTGGRINTLRVLVKPLEGATVDEYLEIVARDRPGSVLP